MGKDSGGSAFHVPRQYAPNGDLVISGHAGMTLRDWFAGQAMQAIFGGQAAQMVADRDQRFDETNWGEIVASNAYEMADAMIAERSKP